MVVPPETRLQCFTVLEFLLVNLLRQKGREGETLRFILSAAPDGASTIALLVKVVEETATSLLLSGRQRQVVSAGLAGEALPPAAAPPLPT